jgi:ABC-type transport system involved in multi-copper enzyme maturation permease subunit
MTATIARGPILRPRAGSVTALLASVRAELMKLIKRPTTWLIGIVWLLLNLMFGYVFPYLGARGAPTGRPPGDASSAEAILAGALPSHLFTTAIQGLPLFGGALAIVFGVLCTGSEYGWGTVKTILTQRPGRLSVIGGKFVVLGLAMVTILVATFAIDAAASAIIASSESKAVDWPSLTALAQGFGAGLLIVSMWCAVGTFLGTALRGTPMAIGLGLIWALVVENLVRGFASVLAPIDALQNVLPGTNAGAIAASLGVPTQSQSQGVPGVTDVVSGTHGVIVLVGYLLAALAVAAVVLRRRDVV